MASGRRGDIAAYSAIGLGTMAIAAERGLHGGREWTYVAVGGALGIATSTLFYLYQDGRFVQHPPTFAQDRAHVLAWCPCAELRRYLLTVTRI